MEFSGLGARWLFSAGRATFRGCKENHTALRALTQSEGVYAPPEEYWIDTRCDDAWNASASEQNSSALQLSD